MVIMGMGKKENIYSSHSLAAQVSHYPPSHIKSSSVDEHISPVRELKEDRIALSYIEESGS